MSNEYVFTADWFTSKIPAWKYIIDHRKPSNLLEIGCFEGRSATFAIDECSALGPMSMTCVDPWVYSDSTMFEVEKRFDNNIQVSIKAAKNPVTFNKIKKPSTIALAEMIASGAKKFDMIYIDGSHDAHDALSDAVMAYHLLADSGVMIFDDYLWTNDDYRKHNPLEAPGIAIDAFVRIFARKIRPIGGLPLEQIFVVKI